MLLGGTQLARHDLLNTPHEKHSILLYFHGGKNRWACEYERWSSTVIYKREVYYGSLDSVMRDFQRMSGQKLQPVTWCDITSGGTLHHSAEEGIYGGVMADPGNPWELEEGAIYCYKDKYRTYEYRAVRVGLGPITQIALQPISGPDDCTETFDPSLLMGRLITGGGREQFNLTEPAPPPQTVDELLPSPSA